MRLLRSLTLGGALVTSAGAACLGGASVSCAPTPSQAQFTQILQPDFAAYHDYVDLYIQRRCGTLDCHGQSGRAFRVYGYAGFRLVTVDANLKSGGAPTTEQEIQANFDAAIALEPEEMSRVIGKEGDGLDNLLLLRKPRLVERHKGGLVIETGDPADRCLTAWLKLHTVEPSSPDDPDFDGLPYKIIAADSRPKLAPASIGDCQTAAALP